jgi:hypothetical protein
MGVDGGLPAPLGLGGNQLGGLLQSLGMPASLNIPGLPGAGGGDAAGEGEWATVATPQQLTPC